MDKCLMNFQDVYLKAKSVFGEKYVVEKIDRLYGGAQKGTYKVKCINGFEFVLYIWDERTSYFFKYEDKRDIFRTRGADLFLSNHRIFENNKVPVQNLYYIDMSKGTYDFHYAFVKYISGKEIEAYMNESEFAVFFIINLYDMSVQKA
jgi:hypothetical protein